MRTRVRAWRVVRPSACAVLALALVGGALIGVAPSALAQAESGDERERPSNRRRNFSTSEWAYRKLSAAHEALAAERFAEARKLLQELSERSGLNPHERALTWQTLGYVHSSEGRTADAIASFEKCLALEALPEGAELATRYDLGQLYLAAGRTDEAVATLTAWLARAENPGASAYYALAVAHLEAGSAAAALPHARQAVALADRPSEPVLALLLALEFELGHTREVAHVLEVLLRHFPKKRYYLQLAAAYAELGQDLRVLATLELAHAQGLLDRESELLNLVRAQLHHGVPLRAARALEQGLADGIVAENADNLRLLGDAWLYAREYDRALDPLTRAAARSGDGNLFVRIGQVHLERDEPELARAALAKGIAKGGLDDPGRARLLLGVAHFEAGRLAEARDAFAQAGEYAPVRREAQSWLAHVERQEALR